MLKAAGNDLCLLIDYSIKHALCTNIKKKNISPTSRRDKRMRIYHTNSLGGGEQKANNKNQEMDLRFCFHEYFFSILLFNEKFSLPFMVDLQSARRDERI